MSAPDQGFWQWIIGAVLGVIGTLFGYHKYLDARFNQKADKDDVADVKDYIKRVDRKLDTLLLHLLGNKPDE